MDVVTVTPSLDRAVLSLRDAGELDAAADALLQRLGPEIRGFLEATVGDGLGAAEAFSLFCEDVWRGLGGFRGDSALRTWCYAVARRAAFRVLRGERERRRRFVAGESQLLEAPAGVRTTTARFVRTAAKEGVRALRASLSDGERELLLLRVDRGLDWRDIAHIQLPEGAPNEDLTRHAAALRKRFERTTGRLRALALDAGLIQP